MGRKSFLVFVYFLLKFIKIGSGVVQVYRSRYRRDILLSLKYFYALDVFRVPSIFEKRNIEPLGSVHELSKDNLRLVSSILEQSNIDFYYIPIETQFCLKNRLAVNVNDIDKLEKAIKDKSKIKNMRAIHGTAMIMVPWNANRISIKKISLHHKKITRWGFYRTHNDSYSNSLSLNSSCEIELFEEKNNQFYFPSPNDISQYLHKNEPTCDIIINGIKLRTWQVMKESILLNKCDFDVDLVYTWVDGSDEDWKVEKKLYEEVNEFHEESLDEGRFTCRQELKYSLRSVAFLTNFSRKIFIVTNGQVPSWLNTKNPKVQVVNHKEIFKNPEGNLPNFNSHSIESNLHRIPGLSEHYIYLNDDMLFLKPLSKRSFFTATGFNKVFLNLKNNFGIVGVNGRETPYVNAGRNTVQIILQKFNTLTASSIRHAPMAQRKSISRIIEKECYNLLLDTESHRFRHQGDISLAASLALHWGLASGSSVEGELETSTIALSDRIDMSLALLRLLVFKDRDCVCLNESKRFEVYTQLRIDRELEFFLKNSFPLKSEFEK